MLRFFGQFWALALVLFALTAPAPARAVDKPIAQCVAPLTGSGAFDCANPQRHTAPGDYRVLLRFAPVVADPADPLVLRMSSVWQDSARVRFRFADGSEAETAFASRDMARVLTIGAIFELPVPVRAAPLDSVEVELRGAANLRGLVLSPELMRTSESVAARSRAIMLYAGFAGLVLALIVFNLSLWSAMRHRFQLFYCGMVAALAAYTFSSSGALSFVWPELDNNLRLRINYFTLWLTLFAALHFARHFFGGRIVGRSLGRAILACSLAGLGATLAFAFLAPWQIWLLDRFYFVTMLAMLCLLPVMLVAAARARSPDLALVIAAWSPPIGLSFLRSLHGFGLIGHSFWLDNSLIVALALEGLMSSILVTARLRELSLERDHARAGEQMARRLAATDPLTGLLNRRAFMELAIGRRSRQRLMLIDIDHFKTINDRFGHANGDDVLRAVAAAIQQCRPARSLAVRLGGEEFALLIPRSAVAECTADMVLEAVRGCALPVAAELTASIGFADGSVNCEEDWARLYRTADAALYRAKSDGRNRACRATDFRAAA